MKYVPVDSIVKNLLLRRGYSMHYYLQFLVYTKDIIRTLTFDDLRIINTVVLTLNSNGNATLPNDYVDYTKVGVMNGQLIRPIVEQQSINRLPNVDTSGNQIPYTNGDVVNNSIYSIGYIPNLYWSLTTYNEYGENIGRLSGLGAGFQTDTFKILPERNIIQCSEFLPYTQIVLEYISDGSSFASTIGVPAYAQDAIEAYCIWQLKFNNRNSNAIEIKMSKDEFDRQRKILRARLNPLGVEEMRRIIQASMYISPKI